MLHILAIVIIVIATVAALISLVDSSLVMRAAFKDISRERALLQRGFVPQAEALELRPRRMGPSGVGQFGKASLRSRSLPRRLANPCVDAA